MGPVKEECVGVWCDVCVEGWWLSGGCAGVSV